MKQYITIKEAAELTGFSQYYLRKRAREGSIPLIRVGNEKTGTYYINAEKLLRQLAAETVPADDPTNSAPPAAQNTNGAACAGL